MNRKHTHNFSLAFEQMCVMAAVAQTNNSEETLQKLILFCFTRFPEEIFKSEDDIKQALLVMSGLDIPKHEIKDSIEKLLLNEKIQVVKDKFVLPIQLKTELLESIEAAECLEEKVKQEWKLEVIKEHPLIDFNNLWDALKKYLSNAFRRHGIQAVSLLDPSSKIDDENIENLSSMLEASVISIHPEHKDIYKQSIRSFMANVGKSYSRTKYITQMADCAFNYFALAIIPEIAEDLRNNLSPLTLFLDTNFLFGILDITVNSQVSVSIELLEAIKKYDLPFVLLYHQETEKELLHSVLIHRNNLRQTKWSNVLSRSILNSRSVNGVELRYHQKNAEETIDVDSYFSPYEHADVLLLDKNIQKFVPKDESTQVVSNMSNNYSNYLDRNGRDKPSVLIEHDMTVLNSVRIKRTQSKNSLDAGALLLTCDYTLFGFDWETCRYDEKLPCTVMPSLFWQLLRPFIPADGDFDKSFAETFAIPEFRLIGSNASITASKIASILNSYKDISEDLATKILSNDLLIGNLKNFLLDEITFHEKVELAIVNEHVQLEEEFAIMQEKLDQKENAIIVLSQELSAKENEIIANQLSTDEIKKGILLEQEKYKENFRTVLALFISLLIIIGVEAIIYLLQWDWFISHSNYWGLQGCVLILIPSIIILLFVPKYKKSSFLVAVISALICTVLSIIDG